MERFTEKEVGSSNVFTYTTTHTTKLHEVGGISRCASVVSGCEDEGRYHIGEKQEVSNVTACRKDARHSPT